VTGTGKGNETEIAHKRFRNFFTAAACGKKKKFTPVRGGPVGMGGLSLPLRRGKFRFNGGGRGDAWTHKKGRDHPKRTGKED